jgi:hypothetical protein
MRLFVSEVPSFMAIVLGIYVCCRNGKITKARRLTGKVRGCLPCCEKLHQAEAQASYRCALAVSFTILDE